MSKILIVGSGPVALYYGALFSMYGYLVDHVNVSKRRKNNIIDSLFVVSELPDFKYTYKVNFVSNLKPWKYNYIIVACEVKRANQICLFLQQGDTPTIVLTSCWNTYRRTGDITSPVIWGFPKILCESNDTFLKAVSSRSILINLKDEYNTPQKVKTFRKLFAKVKIKLQSVNLEYVYPYLFLLTTCMYAQLLNHQEANSNNSIISPNKLVMEDCYADAYVLLAKKRKIPVNQAEFQTGIHWNPKLLINTTELLLRDSKYSSSVTGWIIDQLINYKRTKMQYFIKTILSDKNTNQLNRLRLTLQRYAK